MAISETQKVDYLWKKLAYGLSKTDTNANKRATNESIASPLLLRGENVWAQSSLVPGVMPGSSSGVVTVYPTSSPDETTADSSATLNRTWKTGLTDWISPEYGSTYLVKVYIHTAGQPGSAASSGTQVFGAGSGNNDEWFFDYQSGILHFIGTNLPSGISGKSVYVSGARYTGIKGVAVPGAGATFTALNVTGITTFIDNVQISSLTDNRIAIVGSGSTIEDDANLTFDGSTLAVGVDLDIDGRTELDITNIAETLNVVGISTFASNVDLNADLDVDGRTELDITNISETLNVVGVATFASAVDINNDLDVDGRTELDITNISETLNVVGVSTFASDVDINASIDVDGHTELDDVNVSTAITANNLIVTGSTLLSHSNSLKLQTTGIGVSVSNGIGLTATIAGPSNLIIDPGVVGDNTGIVRIKGDLFVDGEQTQINSTTIELADFIVGIATTATSDLLTDGAGIQIGPNNTFLYEFNGGTNPSLKSSENLNVASGKVYQIDQTERLSADTLSLGTGTTIHSPASNALTFGTNSTEKVRITSDGDVGIGSVIPAGKLDVVGRTELDITNISETLNVVGVSTFASNVDLNADLDVDGRTELDTTNISETLNVTGISTFASDIDINASIDVDGRTELDTTNISETLNVVGIATFVNNIDANADLDVDGRTELDVTNISETLNVVGIATFASNVDLNADLDISGDLDVDGRTELDITNISETLNVTGVSTFASDIDINASIDVDGRTELDITNIAETLNVVGISTFASDVDINASIDVDGHTELDNLNVSGVSTFASDIDINASIDVDGRTELDITNISETLNVVGIATFASDIDVNASIDVDGRTELDITNISETLNVVGIATFASAVDINADLDVDGRIELDITNISETLNVTGVSTFANNIDANGNLDVDGRTELDITNISETLNVSGLSTFSSDIDINASIDVDGRTELDITNISETLNVSGISTFTSAVDIDADLDVDGRTELDITNINETLNVSGISTFTSAVDIDADLDVDGRTELDITNINETLNVTGVSTFANNIDANGNLDVDGRTELDITNINETLNVTGVSTFASAVDINANLDVDGHTELDHVNVSAASTFTGLVDINSGAQANTFKVEDLSDNRVVIAGTGGELEDDSNLTFDGLSLSVGVNLDVDGRTELDITNISETLNVTGVSTFASAVDINANLDVDGRTELDIANISETLNVTGVSTFASAVDINADLDVVGVSTFSDDVNIIDGKKIQLGNSADLQLYHNGTSSYIDNNTSHLYIRNNVDDDDGGNIYIQAKSGENSIVCNDDGNVELYYNNVNTFQTNANGVKVQGPSGGSGILYLHADQGSDDIDKFRFKVEDGGPLSIENDASGSWEKSIEITGNGAVSLYYDNVSRLQTTNTGIDVVGHSELDNVNISGVATATAFHTGAEGSAIRVTSNTISGPAEMFIDPAGVGDNTGVLRIKGDLFVDGTQTIINSTSIELADFVVGIATTATTDSLADGAGIKIGPDNTFLYDHSNTSLKSSENLNLASSKTYKIDGTDVLSATTIGSGVTNSSLTSLGTLTSLTVSGTINANSDLDVDGHTELDNLNVSGVSTFTSDIDINASIDVDGHTELDTLNVSGVSTFTSDIDINASIDVDGHTELDTLKVTGVSTFTNNTIFDSTNSIQIPVGTEAQKDAVGTAVTGQIRFNTTNAQFEGFGVGNNWGSLGGVKDVDGDTFITAEESAGNDDDTLNFYTAGSVRVAISSTGQVGIGSTIPTATLDVLGNTRLVGILTVTGGIDGIGIQSKGTSITTGIVTTLNFVGNGVSSITDTNGLVEIDIKGGTFTKNTTSFTATAGQTTFSLTYTPNFIDVYHNGVKLTASEFTATNGTSVVLSEGAFVGDTIDIVVFQNSGLFDSSKWSLVDTGNQSGDIFRDANVGIGTAIPTDAAHSSNTKILNVGVVTANTIYGNLVGSVTGTITGIADTARGLTGTPNISVGIITADSISVAGTITYNDVTNVDSIGIITARSDVHVGTGLSVAGISTFTGLVDINGGGRADTFKVEDLTDNRVVIVGTGGELEDDSNLTFNGSTLSVGVNLDVDGHTELDDVNVSGASTFSSAVDINADLDVDGHTNLDHVIVSLASTFSDRVIFNSNNSIQIPVGTEGQKDAVGTAVTGQIRFNTTNAQFEGFGVGNNWGSLGGVKDVDGDTFIRAESAAGQDEDELQFITANTNRFVITSGGSVGVGSTIPAAKVDLEGVLGLESTITTVSSTSATTIDTLPIATFRSAKFQIQVTQGSSYQTADLLAIHDGSIASSIEYASLSTSEELAVFTTTISGSNLLLQATMGSASSATVKVVRYGVTI